MQRRTLTLIHATRPVATVARSVRRSLLGRTRSFVADNKLPLIVFLWYFINVVFNIKNKALYNYFPCPAFVSALHLAVGSLWGIVGWLAFPKGNAVFPQRQIMPRKLLLGRNFQLQAMFHGLGHTAVNFSFGAVAVSFTHTVKAMEPFVAAAISQLVFRKKVALPVWLSLVPVVAGVALASAHELSFNWVGFNGAMFSNVAFAFRNYLAKEGLSKELNSTNQYIHLSIVSLLWCIPPIFMLEATKLWPAMQAAAASHGTIPFLGDLFFVGLTYHLYNQLCFNAIEAFDKPLTASVGNVAKRCFVIGFSILYFGNAITPQTAAGTIIAIAGVFLYSMSSAREKQKRAAAEAKAA